MCVVNLPPPASLGLTLVDSIVKVRVRVRVRGEGVTSKEIDIDVTAWRQGTLHHGSVLGLGRQRTVLCQECDPQMARESP